MSLGTIETYQKICDIHKSKIRALEAELEKYKETEAMRIRELEADNKVFEVGVKMYDDLLEDLEKRNKELEKSLKDWQLNSQELEERVKELNSQLESNSIVSSSIYECHHEEVRQLKAENTKLGNEAARNLTDAKEASLAWWERGQKIEKLEAKNKKLKEYATHKGHCDKIYNNDVSLDCSCGFEKEQSNDE